MVKGPLGAVVSIAVLMVLPAGAALATRHLVDFNPVTDEGYNLRFASHLAEMGPRAFPRMFDEYLEGGEERYHYPYPTRVLSILLGAGAIRAMGPGFTSLAWLSLFAFLALLAVLYLRTRRWFGERAALWTTLLCSVAPLHLLLARRALTDTLISLAVLFSLWLLGSAMGIGRERERRSPGRWFLVAASFTAAILVKESAVALIPIALVLMAWQGGRRGKLPGLRPLACVTVLPLLAAGAVALAAAGGPARLWETLLAARGATASPWVAQFLQGPWYRYVVDSLLVSPWTVLLFLCWLGVVAAGRGEEKEAALFWAIVPVLFILCALFFPLKDLRYILPVEIPARLGAVLFLQRVFGEREGRVSLNMALAVAGLVALDLVAFGRFAQADLIEPATLYLLRIDGFLPFIPG